MASRSRNRSAPPPDDDSTAAPADRRLTGIAAAAFLAALILRSLYPGGMSVEHFDEGVYASNLYAWHLDNQYPDRQLYAPPLLPGLLEWAMIFGGGSAHAAMWLNVISGSLTAALIAWVAGRWFGLAAAITAGLLAVTSDVHVVYSRAALTDALLGLWMLSGVYAGWKAVLQGGLLWTALAGVLASLAWWTKYNGWLTLAVTGAGTAAWLTFDRPPVAMAGRAVVRWLATVIIAILLWLPLLYSLQETGGYSAVAANHAKYAVGLTGWFPAFRQQIANHNVLSGWLTIAGLAVLGVFAVLRFRPAKSPPTGAETTAETGPVRRPAIRLDALIGGLGLATVAVFSGSTVVLGVVALITLVVTPLQIDRQSQAPAAADADRLAIWRSQRLAIWMVAAWFFGLLLATPLYHPYPRLTLPWLAAAWLGAGLAVGRLANRRTDSESDERTETSVAPEEMAWLPTGATAAVAAGIATVAALGLGVSRQTVAPAGVVGWEDRTSYARLAGEFLADIEQAVKTLPRSIVPEYDAVVYVFAEPALYFHLASLEGASRLKFITQPAGNLEMVFPEASTDRRLPTFLLTGPHGHRSPEELAAAMPFLAPLSERLYEPSTLVLLNDGAPPLPNREDLPEEYTVRLYHLTFGH